MRVISQDRTIDADYNGTSFYVISDETKYLVVTRSIDYRLYAPMGTFDTEEQAKTALSSISAAFLRGEKVFVVG